jgi:hypothetical protein
MSSKNHVAFGDRGDVAGGKVHYSSPPSSQIFLLADLNDAEVARLLILLPMHAPERIDGTNSYPWLAALVIGDVQAPAQGVAEVIAAVFGVIDGVFAGTLYPSL